MAGLVRRRYKKPEQEGFRPGLEPKSASQISIGASNRSGGSNAACCPDDVGKYFSHTLFGFESIPPSKLS